MVSPIGFVMQNLTKCPLGLWFYPKHLCCAWQLEVFSELLLLFIMQSYYGKVLYVFFFIGKKTFSPSVHCTRNTSFWISGKENVKDFLHIYLHIAIMQSEKELWQTTITLHFLFPNLWPMYFQLLIGLEFNYSVSEQNLMPHMLNLNSLQFSMRYPPSQPYMKS